MFGFHSIKYLCIKVMRFIFVIVYINHAFKTLTSVIIQTVQYSRNDVISF